MIFKYQNLLYNHCKAENKTKYSNVECNFSFTNSYITINNILYKLFYLLFSLPIISEILSIIETFILVVLSYGEVPYHLSYIMDGNRRFAKSINQPSKTGHEIGSTSLIQIIHFAKTVGVKHLSVYAFSIENFNRSEDEVKLLMDLLTQKLTELSYKITNSNKSSYKSFKGIQIKIVGDRSYLSSQVAAKVKEIEEKTTIKNASDVFFNLYICCPYTSRNEIFHSMKTNIELKKERGNDYIINEASLEKEMFLSKYIPTCDYLIRTSGATRFSDYLMWQSHNQCAFVFSQTLWPDYGFTHFVKNIISYGYFKSLYSWNKLETIANKKHPCSTTNHAQRLDIWKYSLFQASILEKQIFFPIRIISRALYSGKNEVLYKDLKIAPKSSSITERN